MNIKKVIVLMATFNGEKFIVQQLQSIINQSEVDVDIIIYDDGSSDRTVEIIKDFKTKNPLIKIELNINSTPTGSAAVNFLNGLSELNQKKTINDYDFISLSDQDDIWFPNKLKEASLKLNSSYDLYCSNLLLYDTFSGKTSLISKSHSQSKFDHLFEGGSAGCTYVMNRKAVETIIFNYNRTKDNLWQFFSHDWFIYFICRLNNLRVFIDHKSYIKYRLHSTNVHGGMNKFTVRAIVKRIKLLNKNWYKKHSLGIINFLEKESNEHQILLWFNKSYFHRMFIISKYNFQLFRSPYKFLKFYILNLLYISK